jgi:hypothetical protein
MRAWLYRQTLTGFQTAIFQVAELVVVVAMVVWALIGAWHYGTSTEWKLTGLLTLLDERWKGALILCALAFYRSVRELLGRTRKGPMGMEFLPPPLVGEPQTIGRLGDPQGTKEET